MKQEMKELVLPTNKQTVRAFQILMIFACLVALMCGVARAEDDASPPQRPEMPIGHALALGVVEGLTEYLPVSSTGHLIILQHYLGQKDSLEEKEAADAFAICIQSGAILAVVVLYYRRLLQMLRGLMGGDHDGLKLFFNLIIAFIPAAVFGVLFHKIIKAKLFNIYTVSAALVVGALMILLLSLNRKSDAEATEKDLVNMTWWEAALVGCFQCLAFWPGFSRSLATIVGCRLVKLRMSAAVEFSFLLGLITLSAATAKDGLSHGGKIIELYGVTPSAIALIAAFISAVISVKFMITFLNRFGLTPFAYYRLVLAALCLILL